MRYIRNILIKNTDWTQLIDTSLTDEQKQAYQVYRQSLRDIPNQEGFPDKIIWPAEPGGNL